MFWLGYCSLQDAFQKLRPLTQIRVTRGEDDNFFPFVPMGMTDEQGEVVVFDRFLCGKVFLECPMDEIEAADDWAAYRAAPHDQILKDGLGGQRDRWHGADTARDALASFVLINIELLVQNKPKS